jgi:hypothetical protein
MGLCRVQQGDTLKITVTLIDCATNLAIDVSSASDLKIILRTDGVRIEKTAAFLTDGTDGKITVTLDAGEISPAGRWNVQGQVTIGSLLYHSSVTQFVVGANL